MPGAARSSKAKPRARLAITAKSKPPAGDSNDFTMVFTDVQGAPSCRSCLRSLHAQMLCLGGSTSLWEANPRAMELALRLHDATIRQVLAKHSGYEAQIISKRASQVAYALGSSELMGLGWQVTTEGDAFQIAFHDTADAVAFCLDTQAELLRCDWPDATLSHPDAAVPDPAKAENAQVVMMWVSPGLMASHHSWQPRPVVMEPGVDCVCAWVCTPAGRPLSPSTRLGGLGADGLFCKALA